jgi:hypothetical protein
MVRGIHVRPTVTASPFALFSRQFTRADKGWTVTGSETLRDALDRIISISFPSEYEATFEEVRRQHGHTIRLLKADRAWLQTFNCYAAALDIVDHPKYRSMVNRYHNSLIPTSDFVSNLLDDQELQELDASTIEMGDIVLYFDGDKVRHGASVASPKRLRSKWGFDKFYEHSLWEVPWAFGDQVKFFIPPDPERIMELLLIDLRARPPDPVQPYDQW